MNPTASNSPWMSGDQANAVATGKQILQVATTIFAVAGSNRYVENNYFKPEEIVVEEVAINNKAYIAAGGTILLFIVALIVILR